jgi:dTDP-4-dehydrorhamnose reductase
MPAKILVTGAGGMLAADLVPVLRSGMHEVVALDRARLDVTDADQVRAVITAERPGVVIHCAAYTNVDGAEADPDTAFRVNRDGARFVAEACQEVGATMVYVSTDYVFDGENDKPWEVDDPPRPLGVYGKSKLEGELAVRRTLPAHFVVRTSWLYGHGGKNFVDTMRKLGREKPELAVVNDQVGSPTWTLPLSEAIAALVATTRYGVYHLTGSGQCTWYDLTKKIMALEGLPTTVKPITTAELGRPAPRPRYSVLSAKALQIPGVTPLPAWEDSLARYLALVPAA